jgi:hypothetical protein
MLPGEIELLLPLWAHLLSEGVFILVLAVEGAFVLGLSVAIGIRFRQSGPLRRRLPGVLGAICSALGIAIALALINAAINILIWIGYGQSHQGQSAPFW